MSQHPKFYCYPGWGEWARENIHYSQAVRVGDRIICAGQGGWNPDLKEPDPANLVPNDIGAQVDQAFANCDLTLRHAGGQGLSQAFKVVTYSTDPSSYDHIVRNLRQWMPNNPPIWTALGVTYLAGPGMKIEIDVEAYDPVGAKKELA